MKNISDKNKRWLSIAGLGVVCIALVIAISSQFKTEAPADDVTAPTSTVTGEVNPSTDVSNPAGGKNVVIQASEPTTTSTETPNTVDSTGTEQTIQPDLVKPEAPKETPKPQGETTNPSKAPTYKPEDTTVSKSAEPKGGDTNGQGQIYVPGFGWVDNSGENVGTTAEDMYENGNKIGEMN